MSGGFVYQYDPAGELADRASDSLVVQPLVGGGIGLGGGPDLPRGGRAADAAVAPRVDRLGRWRPGCSRTGRRPAPRSWWGRRRRCCSTRTATRSWPPSPARSCWTSWPASVATDRLRQFKLSLRDGHAVAGGRTPVFGEPTSPDAYAVLSSYTVLAIAQEIALERVPGTTGPGDPRITAAARKLVLTEDFVVRQKLLRYVRGKLERFDDAELAAQIAMKRLGDYQRSLELRNVRGMDAPGTYGWILHQQQKNASWLDRSQFDELLVERRAGRPGPAGARGARRGGAGMTTLALHPDRRAVHPRPAGLARRLPGRDGRRPSARRRDGHAADPHRRHRVRHPDRQQRGAGPAAGRRRPGPRSGGDREPPSTTWTWRSCRRPRTCWWSPPPTARARCPTTPSCSGRRWPRDGAPRLEDTRYAVLSLGDSGYEGFCQAGRLIDTRLEQLGAVRVVPRVDCDVDFEDPATAWLDDVVEHLAAEAPGAAGAALPTAPVPAPTAPRPARQRWTRRDPYRSRLVANRVLSGAAQREGDPALRVRPGRQRHRLRGRRRPRGGAGQRRGPGRRAAGPARSGRRAPPSTAGPWGSG